MLVVPEGRDVYSTTEGVYKIRLGEKCLPLEGQQLRGLRALRQKYDWSAEPSGFGPEALSRAALEQAARRLRDLGHAELADRARGDLPAFCDATGLTADRDGQVNRAAVLLYGNTEALRSLQDGGVNAQTRDSPGGEPRILMRRDDADVPLVLLLDRLMTITGALAGSLSIRVGATQVELVTAALWNPGTGINPATGQPPTGLPGRPGSRRLNGRRVAERDPVPQRIPQRDALPEAQLRGCWWMTRVSGSPPTGSVTWRRR